VIGMTAGRPDLAAKIHAQAEARGVGEIDTSPIRL